MGGTMGLTKYRKLNKFVSGIDDDVEDDDDNDDYDDDDNYYDH